MKKMDKRSLADKVYDHIKESILSGVLKPGEKIPEEKIAEDTGVSRTPIREAIRRLSEFGLVEVQPRSWAAVAQLSEKQLADLVEARVNIEVAALRSLANIPGKMTLTALEKVQKRLEKAAEKKIWGQVFSEDSNWHLELIKLSGNNIYFELLERLDARVQLARLQKCKNEKVIQKDVAYHRSIMKLMAEGKIAKAADLLGQHISGAGSI